MEIEEGNLRFKFADTWSYLLKYDERDEGGKPKLAEYRKIHDATNGAKAVDFIGMLNINKLVLMEVKDFRGHRIENKERISSGELATEVATKVRDTFSAIVGAYRTSESQQKEYFENYFNILADRKRDVYVVLWQEDDRSNMSKPRQYNDIQLLKQKLSWLTNKVHILSKSDNSFSVNLAVEYLKM